MDRNAKAEREAHTARYIRRAVELGRQEQEHLEQQKPQKPSITLNNLGSLHVGDKNRDSYTTSNAGIMGPNATGNTLNFHQLWNQSQGSVNIQDLARELGTLRAAMLSKAQEPDQHMAVDAVAAAAAKAGDGPKALNTFSKRVAGRLMWPQR